MINELGHAIALRELSQDKDFRRFLKVLLVVFAVAAACGAYLALVLYAVGSYLGLLS